MENQLQENFIKAKQAYKDNPTDENLQALYYALLNVHNVVMSEKRS